MTELPEIVRILNELKDEVRCRCSPSHTGRGLHEPNCADYLVDDILKIIDYVMEDRNANT